MMDDDAAPEHLFDPVTGVVDGDELRAARARRPTPQRIAHLEERQDETVRMIAEWRAEFASNMGNLTAQVGSLAGEVRGLATVVTDSRERERVAFRAQTETSAHATRSKWDLAKTALAIVGTIGAIVLALVQARHC